MGLIESCKKATRDPAVLMVSGFALEKCPEAVSAASLTNERQEIDGSADTHWAVCTALGSGCLCWGPRSPGPPPAPPRDWQRFPSRARGEVGGEALRVFVPTLTNEADIPSPASHPAQESLGARGAAGALEQLHPLTSSACAGTTKGALFSLATQPPATSRSKPACSSRLSKGVWLVPVN